MDGHKFSCHRVPMLQNQDIFKKIRPIFKKSEPTCIYLVFLNLCLASSPSVFIVGSLVLVISLINGYGPVYLLF